MGMFSKYFSPQEANHRLPLVKRIVLEILAKGKQLRSLLAANKGQDIPTEYQVLEEEIESLMEELEGLGCFYKDWNFEIGLVDFPALIEGQEVLLCWKSDEPEILWYHTMEEGFAGRRPIPEYWLINEDDVFKNQ